MKPMMQKMTIKIAEYATISHVDPYHGVRTSGVEDIAAAGPGL